MPLSPARALDVVRDVIAGPRSAELPRLERIASELRPYLPHEAPPVDIPRGAPASLVELARKAATNVLPLVLDAYAQALVVEGLYAADSTELTPTWSLWQASRCDASQSGLHRAALAYGTSYALVEPAQRLGADSARITFHSPRRLTALYRTEGDEWPELAVIYGDDDVRLIDDQAVYTFSLGRASANLGLLPGSTSGIAAGGSWLELLRTEEHGLGVVPITRYRPLTSLHGEGSPGIIEPLVPVQRRIEESVFGLLVSQRYQAFKQRYVVGYVAEDATEAFRLSQATLWQFEDPDVKIGELDAADLRPFVDAKQDALRDLATVAQLPMQALGVGAVSNISAEALDSLEMGKARRVDEMTLSLGEAHEQTLRLAAYAAGDMVGAQDYSSELRWRDTSARSFAQEVDGLTKLASPSGLAVPPEILWGRIPGFTDQMVERAKLLRAEQDPLRAIGDAFGASPAPQQAPPA